MFNRLDGWLEKRLKRRKISTKPSVSRWGITQIVLGFSLFLIAVSIAFISLSIALWGINMTLGIIALSLAVILIGVGVFMFCYILIKKDEIIENIRRSECAAKMEKSALYRLVCFLFKFLFV